MTSLPVILDVAIGMIFIFLTLSAICSSINEFISTLTKARSKYLEQGIIDLLTDQDTKLASDVINDPLIRRLGSSPKVFPAYIPSRDFVIVLLNSLRVRGLTTRFEDIKKQLAQNTDQSMKPVIDALNVTGVNPDEALAAAQKAASAIQDPNTRAQILSLVSPQNLEEIHQGILALPEPTIRGILLTLYNDAQSTITNEVNEVEALKQRLEDWFNNGMGHVSELYKRYVQIIMAILAFFICVLFNADALHIFNTLWTDPTVRAALVQQGQAAAQAPAQATPAPNATPSATDLIDKARGIQVQLEAVSNLPIGWNCNEYNAIMRAGGKSTALQPGETPTAPGLCNPVTQSQPDGSSAVMQVQGGSFSPTAFLLKLVGLALMIGGVSFGAPFWFQTLQKFLTFRQDKPKAD